MECKFPIGLGREVTVGSFQRPSAVVSRFHTISAWDFVHMAEPTHRQLHGKTPRKHSTCEQMRGT